MLIQQYKNAIYNIFIYKMHSDKIYNKLFDENVIVHIKTGSFVTDKINDDHNSLLCLVCR